MNKISSLFILIFATFSAFATTDIALSKKIKPKLQNKIIRDLSLLDSFPFRTATDLKTLHVLGISELSAETAGSWLNKRVKYIVEENLPLKKVLYVEKDNVDFPTPDTKTFSDVKTMGTASSVMMTNLGAGLYMQGKTEHRLYGIKISSNRVRINSPQSGVLQIQKSAFR